jgi:hypothetical protein
MRELWTKGGEVHEWSLLEMPDHGASEAIEAATREVDAGRYVGMEEGTRARSGPVQVQAKAATTQPRPLVSQVLIDHFGIKTPNVNANIPPDTEAPKARCAVRGADMGRSIQEGNSTVEITDVSATEAERSLGQKVQHDESQLEAKGIRAVNVMSLFLLLQAQGCRCALSGRPLTPENVVLDHVNPFSESNDHSLENVQLVVQEANQAKGCLTNEEFIKLCFDVAARHGMLSPG